MIETFIGWLFAALLALLAPHPAAIHAVPRHHPQPQPPVVAAPAPAAPSTASVPVPNPATPPEADNPCGAVADTYAGDADPAGDPCGLGLPPVVGP